MLLSLSVLSTCVVSDSLSQLKTCGQFPPHAGLNAGPQHF